MPVVIYSSYTPEQVKELLGPAIAAAAAAITNNYKLDPRKTQDYGIQLWTAISEPLVDYLYAKASGSAPDLEAVTTTGNVTTNSITAADIIATGDLQTQGNLYLNTDGSPTQAQVYFYDGGISGAWLGYNSADNAFTFSNVVRVPHPSGSLDAANKSFVENLVETIDTLQEITDNGNTTTNPIIVTGSGSTFNSLTVPGPVTIDGVVDVRSNNIISLAEPTNSQDATTKNYVDNASGSCAQDLQNVTNYGNTTTKEIIAATLSSNTNIYINKDGGDADSYLYFYEGSATGRYLKWANTSDRFEVNDLFSALGLQSTDTRFAVTATSADGTDTNISIRNTSSGDAVLFMDAQNGDLAGGDYASIRQKNAGPLEIQLLDSAPDWQISLKGSTVTYLQILKTSPEVQVVGDFAASGFVSGSSIRATDNIYINYDGPSADSYLYFYFGSETGAYLQWYNIINKFNLSHGLVVNGAVSTAGAGGNITSTSYIDAGSYIRGTEFRSEGNIYINYDGADGDSYLYFYENSSTTGAYLMWDDSTDSFAISDGLRFPAADAALVTSGHNAFTSGTHSGFGRFGVFQEPYYLSLGFPNIASRYFQVAKYDADSTYTRLLEVDVDGHVTVEVGDLKVNGDIQVNSDGGDGDSFLYFYENSSATGAYLKFDDTDDRFEVNHRLAGITPSANDDLTTKSYVDSAVAGATNGVFGLPIQVSGSIYTTQNMHLNADGADADSYLYFYENSSATGAYIMWDDSESAHKLSHSLIIPKRLVCTEYLQSITAATDTITSDYTTVVLNPDAPYTLTSTPTIAAGISGQRITIINLGSDTVTLQDNDTLSGSNLEMHASTVALASRDSITFEYLTSGGANRWFEIGYVNNA